MRNEESIDFFRPTKGQKISTGGGVSDLLRRRTSGLHPPEPKFREVNCL